MEVPTPRCGVKKKFSQKKIQDHHELFVTIMNKKQYIAKVLGFLGKKI